MSQNRPPSQTPGDNGQGENSTIKVLVVDDSAYMRYVLRSSLAANPDIQVLDTARDGLDALSKISALHPDVVTMDLEMPRMNGFEALKRIMETCPLPVIILSSLTQEGADATLRALDLGAVDFVPKPANGSISLRAVGETLAGKIRQVSGLDASKLRATRPRAAKPPVERPARAERPAQGHGSRKIVVIGTSTGGPRALHEVVPHLPGALPAGVLIVQHMPPGFTRSLAQRLNEISQLEVKEAEPGDQVRPGLALLAPGNHHMIVTRQGTVELDERPPEHGVRPAVDVTMESVVQFYGEATVGVILTGMGSDGTRGAGLIKGAGGQVIAEDKSTSIIYGMPRSVIEAGLADKVVPLDRMAAEIVAAAEERKPPRTPVAAGRARASARASD